MKAADDAGLRYEVQVLDHRNPPVCLYVTASCVSEIIELLPDEEHEELRQFYYRRLQERSEERGAFWGINPDDLISQAVAAEWLVLKHFAGVVPTTIDGLLAKITYAGKLAQDPDIDRFDDVNSLASAAHAVGAE